MRWPVSQQREGSDGLHRPKLRGSFATLHKQESHPCRNPLMILGGMAQFEDIAGWGISVPAVKTSERRPSIEMTLQGRPRSSSVNCNPTIENRRRVQLSSLAPSNRTTRDQLSVRQL